VIFATVGTQLPFPRLIASLDALAPELGEPIVAQTGSGGEKWNNLDRREHLAPAEFEALFAAARIVVAHAGIGTILSAKRLGRPLVILPRRHALGEHRNDHQLATARQVEALPGIHVAWQAEDLGPLLARSDLAPATEAGSPSHDALIARLRNFIAG
jgi:UDP-N-acetylglucosamine transferase subunit ALG13